MQEIETVKEFCKRLEIEFIVSSNYYKSKSKRVEFLTFSFKGGPALEKIFRDKIKKVGIIQYEEYHNIFHTEIVSDVYLLPGEEWGRYVFQSDRIVDDFPEVYREYFNTFIIQEVLPFFEDIFFEYYPEYRNGEYMSLYENNAKLFFNLIGEWWFMVIVYSKEKCPACVSTKKYLEKHGIAYEEKSIYEYLEEIEEKGERKVLSAPVVEYKKNNKTIFIYGFLPNEILKVNDNPNDDSVWDF